MSAVPAAVLLVLAVAPELQARHEWLAMAASFAPYGWVAWLLALVLALAGARGRTRLAAAPLALGLAWHTAMLVPYLPAPTIAAASPSASVLELNLHDGRADLRVLARQVREARPDVVVLAEVTTANEEVFGQKAWTRMFPYRAGSAGQPYDPKTGIGDSRGTLVLSRYPLSATEHAAATRFTNLAVVVELPDHPFTLVAAHPVNPECGADAWVSDADALTRLALKHDAGPLVVAGDLNATAEHLTLRQLSARTGLTDAGAGHGWQPTFPADAWYPPLIQIDHVLVSREFRTLDHHTIRVPGTDHLGLVVRLSLG